MKTSASLIALRKKILTHLPPIEQRVYKREVEQIVRDAQARGEISPAGFLQLYAEYGAQSRERQTRFEVLRAAHAEAQTSDERREILSAALRSEHAPRRAFSALRRGWLDLDAMAERAAFDRHALTVRQALSLRAATAIIEERSEQATYTINTLLELLLTELPVLCAVAGAEALTELLGRIPEWPESLDGDARWQALGARLLDSELPRRVRAALGRLCLSTVPQLALANFDTVLSRKCQEDFILRQHLITLLGQRPADQSAFAILTAHVFRADPSEHVRMALPRALRTTGGDAAVPLLEALAGIRADRFDADVSPRVRAAAAIALAELVHEGVADTTLALAELIADPDPLVCRVVAEEVEALTTQHKLDGAQIDLLRAAFARQVAPLKARSAATHDVLMRTLEVLATADDPEFTGAESDLAARLAALPEGGILHVRTRVQPMVFGRLLARLSRDDFGYDAWPVQNGYCVERGARFVRRTWRVLHEVRNPTPYKRQDALHSVGRRLRGTLRAPSGLLAQATHTSVPGEITTSPNNGQLGAQLPTVDDLLALPILRGDEVTIFGGQGTTQLRPPNSLVERVWNRLRLNVRYSELADLRQRSIERIHTAERNRYLQALEDLGIGVKLRPYANGEPQPSALLRPSPSKDRRSGQFLWPETAAMLALPGGLSGGLADFGHYLMSPAENTLGQLGFAAAFAGVFLIAGNLQQREEIRKSRAAIPLCIGGWGTRGKSGTERLKAAMMQGLELNVLTKTTGCEAMFIHGVPGRKATEIFIHRSYDKATIWEQRDLLNLAARLRVDVFLWECMGLSAPLVQTLAEDWMRDDLQTLTNAYPDHEDLQGPAGHDVARTIAGFMRSGGTTITTEEQMLPILAEEARARQARLISVASREHLMLADDLLARFPYREHPRNIALVRRLAVELGLDPDLATADMAEHVVPDLGVLKAYPVARHRERRLIFVNGMSANERTGFLSNWQRTGCDRPVGEPGRWVMTVVNNRFDRVARSKVFAEILVRDAAAERHVLIGTNLSGLRGYIEEALTRFLPELRCFQDDTDLEQLPALLATRIQRLQHLLRIGPAEPAAILRELSGLVGGVAVESLHDDVQMALDAAAEWAAAEDALPVIEAKVLTLPWTRKVMDLRPTVGDELADYVARSIARRALLHSLEQAAKHAITSQELRRAVGLRQDRIYRELFHDMIIAVDDEGASGDQIIDVIAKSCPPGVEATVMGIQNIKGTGLDFVYRFIRYDEVQALVEKLALADARAARRIVDELLSRTDFGMLDSTLAHRAVRDAAERFVAEAGLAEFLTRAADRLGEVARGCQAAVRPGRSQQKRSALRIVEKALDSVDAVRRRWHADEILDALVHREISHERAALEARRLVDREKKGWLRDQQV
jgi:poly-gamma-glutamate synthase PgsB/CapB